MLKNLDGKWVNILKKNITEGIVLLRCKTRLLWWLNCRPCTQGFLSRVLVIDMMVVWRQSLGDMAMLTVVNVSLIEGGMVGRGCKSIPLSAPHGFKHDYSNGIIQSSGLSVFFFWRARRLLKPPQQYGSIYSSSSPSHDVGYAMCTVHTDTAPVVSAGVFSE